MFYIDIYRCIYIYRLVNISISLVYVMLCYVLCMCFVWRRLVTTTFFVLGGLLQHHKGNRLAQNPHLAAHFTPVCHSSNAADRGPTDGPMGLRGSRGPQHSRAAVSQTERRAAPAQRHHKHSTTQNSQQPQQGS